MGKLLHLHRIKRKNAKKGLKRSFWLVLFSLWFMNRCWSINRYGMVFETVIKCPRHIHAPTCSAGLCQIRWAGIVSSWLPAAVQASWKCLLLSSSEFIKVLLFYPNIRYPCSQLPVMPTQWLNLELSCSRKSLSLACSPDLLQ